MKIRGTFLKDLLLPSHIALAKKCMQIEYNIPNMNNFMIGFNLEIFEIIKIISDNTNTNANAKPFRFMIIFSIRKDAINIQYLIDHSNEKFYIVIDLHSYECDEVQFIKFNDNDITITITAIHFKHFHDFETT